MKLSIIIPTLRQRNSKWELYIENVIENIIALNEEIYAHFEEFEIITIEDKLVNEAWNEWVKKANWEIVLIINDDIIIQELVFETLSKLEKWQVYCPYFSRKDDHNKIHSHNWDNIVWFCFGMYKEDWKDIPKELTTWFGDNFIYEYMNHNILWWGYIHHYESKSLKNPSRKEYIDKLIENDKLEWNKIKCSNSISTN